MCFPAGADGRNATPYYRASDTETVHRVMPSECASGRRSQATGYAVFVRALWITRLGIIDRDASGLGRGLPN